MFARTQGILFARMHGMQRVYLKPFRLYRGWRRLSFVELDRARAWIVVRALAAIKGEPCIRHSFLVYDSFEYYYTNPYNKYSKWCKAERLLN